MYSFLHLLILQILLKMFEVENIVQFQPLENPLWAKRETFGSHYLPKVFSVQKPLILLLRCNFIHLPVLIWRFFFLSSHPRLPHLVRTAQHHKLILIMAAVTQIKSAWFSAFLTRIWFLTMWSYCHSHQNLLDCWLKIKICWLFPRLSWGGGKRFKVDFSKFLRWFLYIIKWKHGLTLTAPLRMDRYIKYSICIYGRKEGLNTWIPIIRSE